jgi:hypothetical protein
MNKTESLRKIKEVAETFLSDVSKFKDNIAEIKQNAAADASSNVVYNEFYQVFNEEFLDEIVNILEKIAYKKIKEEMCDHEFVWDRVETGVDCDMMSIQYCKFCNIVEK